MSDARLDPDLRLGPYLLVDMIRSMGFAQWFLSNITGHAELCGSMLAEFMVYLEHVGIAKAGHAGFGGIVYDNPHYIGTNHLEPRLTRAEAETLMAEVCARAEKLNLDDDCIFHFKKLYLFGSHLSGSQNPGDLDLGVEVHYKDGPQVREPSYIPFSTGEHFYDAVRQLANRKRRKISIHDIRELISIGAPHRLIWTEDRGLIKDALVVQPPAATRPIISKEATTEKQVAFDALAARIAQVKQWPTLPPLDLGDAPNISRARWLEYNKDIYLVSIAHVQCLPQGTLRDHWQQEMERSYAGKKEYARAKRLANTYLKACLAYNPWSVRTNGRLLRRSDKR